MSQGSCPLTTKQLSDHPSARRLSLPRGPRAPDKVSAAAAGGLSSWPCSPEMQLLPETQPSPGREPAGGGRVLSLSMNVGT